MARCGRRSARLMLSCNPVSSFLYPCGDQIGSAPGEFVQSIFRRGARSLHCLGLQIFCPTSAAAAAARAELATPHRHLAGRARPSHCCGHLPHACTIFSLTRTTLPFARTMSTTSAPRVAVIGGGMIGASSAYYLTERGAKVTIIEGSSIAAGASGKAGGLLALDWHGQSRACACACSSCQG